MRYVNLALILIWLAGLVLCVAPILYYWSYIPNMRGVLFGKAIGCLAPQLSAMLAFTFSKASRRRLVTAASPVDALALTVSALYVGTFVVLFSLFAFHLQTATDLRDQLELLQPAITFLVSGVLAYYFGAK